MVKKKKYPIIEPEFSKDKKTVYLDVDVYNSIFEEIEEIKKKLKNSKLQKNNREKR